MNNVAHKQALAEADLETSTHQHLGRAVVCACGGGRLRVRLASGEEVDAKLAVPFGYRPSLGDELVIISQETRYFVIGLVEVADAVELRFSGDVDLTSVHGDVRLSAAKNLELRASEVRVRSRVMSVVADRIVETAATLYQRVNELLSVQAGEKHEVVDGDSSTRAGRIHLASEELVKVNGKEIHLG